MISAGEVGAVFTIVDEASPVLRRIMEQMDALQASIDKTKLSLKELTMPPGLNRSLGVTEKRFKGIADSSRLTGDVVTGAFAKIDAAVAASAANMANINRELKSISAESRVVGRVGSIRYGGGAGRRDGAPHASPVHFGGAGVPLPGDQHMRVTGGPALVAAGAVGYGAFEAAKIEDFVNRIFLTGGISTGSQATNPLARQISDTILKAYTMTGLPLDQIEEGILTGTRGLAGIDLEKRLKLMPGLLAASATEAYLKDGTTIPEAMQAFVGLAHMEGKYKPEEIAKLADHFAYLSTTTPVSVAQVERAASYAIPMLRTADFDPEQLLLMITSMERAGITNTKAGTWISQLATQSFPGTSLMSKMLFKKHEAALKALGLVDPHDKPTWFTDGRPDLVKMTGIAGDAIAKMDPAHRLAVEKALWGQQGGRAAGFFADPTNRGIMGAVAGEEKEFISGEKMWKQSLENSPIVQFRTAFAGLNVELINLGSNVLPYVTGMLKQANATLGGKGELTAIGGGLLGWMFRKPLAKLLGSAGGGLLSSIGGGLESLGLGAAELAPPVAAATVGAGILAWIHQYAVPRTPSDWPDEGQFKRAYDANSAFRRDPEAAHGSAYHNLPPPITNVDVKVHVTNTLDGASIASHVETQILKNNRTVDSSNDHDGRADWQAPDVAPW